MTDGFKRDLHLCQCYKCGSDHRVYYDAASDKYICGECWCKECEEEEARKDREEDIEERELDHEGWNDLYGRED